MGFWMGNEEQKQRINLSEKAWMVMHEDMSVFNVPRETTFMNTVIVNFHNEAKASCESYLHSIKEKMKHFYDEANCPASVRDALVQQYVDKERISLKKYAKEQTSNKAHSFLCRINNENIDWLQSDECIENQFYDNSLGLYLKCLIEEYAQLPYIEREKVYFKEFYETIEIAITSGLLLKMHRADGRVLYAHPYKLIEDPLSTRYYLACYTKPERLSKEKSLASLRISRLKDIRILQENGGLTQKEKQQIEKALAVRSIQFLIENEDEIHVFLTDIGIRKYHQQLHLRPTVDTILPDQHTYVFHCTQSQAEFYFFKFGKDAQILSPQVLREKFQSMYSEALDAYNTPLNT